MAEEMTGGRPGRFLRGGRCSGQGFDGRVPVNLRSSSPVTGKEQEAPNTTNGGAGKTQN
jgi:hypothetical protein